MKIVVCGEGGSGKSTIAALLAAVDSENKIAGIIPANNDVFRTCLAGKALDLQLAEIDELAMFIRAGKTER